MPENVRYPEYRPSHLAVEALHYMGEVSRQYVRQFVSSPISERSSGLEILNGLGEWVRVDAGDWIIKYLDQDVQCYLALSDSMFAMLYELVP